MNFKEMMDGDLDLLFNPEEIGEKAIFEENEIVVVKSSESFRRKYKGKSEEMGIYTTGICVSIKKSDFPTNVEVNDTVELDGKSYEVIDIEIQGNTYRIDLTANRR